MNVARALLLGALQGLTEFLPVSSTAHLYILQALLKIQNDAVALSFDVVLHLGTGAALALAMGGEILRILRELPLLFTGRPARDPAARAVILPLAAGTVPGVLAGLLLLKRVESLRTLGLIGLSMLVACAYFLFSERRGRRILRERDLSKLTLADGLWIGLAQAAAGLMAGFSRSGLTIATGRLRGLARGEAARFSFLLGLPIILGAGAKTLLDARKAAELFAQPDVLAVGFGLSFLSGLAAVAFMVRFLRGHSLNWFVAYRMVLAAAILAAVSVGAL